MMGRVWAFIVSLICVAPAFAGIPSTIGWHELANTKIDTVGACGMPYGTGPFPDVCGNGQGDILAWSSGVYDYVSNRLIVWGGGHANYYGNEFYALNLMVDPITMTRLNDPTLPIATSCSAGIPTASPTAANSRHTYDGIEFTRFTNSMFVFEGSVACGSGAAADDTWTYNFGTATWTQRTPSGDNINSPNQDFGMTSAWDAATGLVFIFNRCALFTYNPTTNVYRQIGNTLSCRSYYFNGALDPVTRQFVAIGDDPSVGGFRVLSLDISGVNASGAPPTSTPTWQTRSSSDPGFPNSAYPGCDYYPRGANIVCWNGGNSVYKLNTTSWSWSSSTYTGGPGSAYANNGTNGRWRYSPYLDVFVLVNSTSQNAYALRLDSPLSANTDFATRCAAPGVIVCEGFDATLPLSTGNGVTGVKPDWQGGYTRQALDTSIKASGASSFRLNIDGNTSANMAGEYRQVWSPAFGEGDTMYTSFRYRVDSDFISIDWPNVVSSWPKIILHHNQAATCADLEWTLTNDSQGNNIPSSYTDCGGQQVVTNGGIPPYDYQQGHLKCSYGSTDTTNSQCLFLESNKWMTFKFKATIGTWGSANSTLEGWFAIDGLPWRKFISISNFSINNSGPVLPGFDSVTLTPYMTGKSTAVSHAQAQVWYDELIVSSQDIAAPLPVPQTVSTSFTPSAPTDVRVASVEGGRP